MRTSHYPVKWTQKPILYNYLLVKWTFQSQIYTFLIKHLVKAAQLLQKLATKDSNVPKRAPCGLYKS